VETCPIADPMVGSGWIVTTLGSPLFCIFGMFQLVKGQMVCSESSYSNINDNILLYCVTAIVVLNW
jgi:hypothetical protein